MLRTNEIKVLTLAIAIDSIRKIVHDYRMENLTYQDRVAILIGKDEGEHVPCQYFIFANGQPVPACLIGIFLARHGVTNAQLQGPPSGPSLNASTCNNVFLSLKTIGEFNVIDPEAETFLKTVQSSQDNGETWGQALKNGLAVVESVPEPEDQGFSETTYEPKAGDVWDLQALISLGRKTPSVLALVGVGSKIEAIKRLRIVAKRQTETLPSLIDVKRAVEVLIDENPPF